MFTKTSSELAPEEDQGFLLSIVNAPRYATSDYTELYVNQMLGLVKDIPETRAQFSAVAFGGETSGAFVGFAFKDWAERTRSSKEIQADIQGRLAKVAGVQAFVFAPPTLPGSGGGLPITMVVRSTGDAAQVFEAAEEIKNKTNTLAQAAMKLGEAMYKAQQADAQAGAAASGAPGEHGGGAANEAKGEKVVDAEFEDVTDKNKKTGAG